MRGRKGAGHGPRPASYKRGREGLQPPQKSLCTSVGGSRRRCLGRMGGDGTKGTGRGAAAGLWASNGYSAQAGRLIQWVGGWLRVKGRPEGRVRIRNGHQWIGVQAASEELVHQNSIGVEVGVWGWVGGHSFRSMDGASVHSE